MRTALVVIFVYLISSVFASPVPARADNDWPTLASPAIMPVTDGEYMIWLEGESGSLGQRSPIIRAMQLDTGALITVSDSSNAKTEPAIDSGIAVWLEEQPECPRCYATIQAADLDSGATWQVTDQAWMQYAGAPAKSGDYVVWLSSANLNGELHNVIWARNIRTMESAFIVSETSDWSCYHRYPAKIDGDIAVWMECYEPDQPFPDGGAPGYRIWAQRLDGHGRTLIVDESSNPQGFDISNGIVVYSDHNANINTYEITTGERRVLAAQGSDPAILSRYIVWDRITEVIDDNSTRSDVIAYDLTTEAEFTAVSGSQFNLNADLGGHFLVWETGPDDYGHLDVPFQVQVAPFIDLLPASGISRESASAGSVWFPETGHTLDQGFRSFWEANGALPVFGYPLTQEFSERNSDLGESFTVQYLERQRFEFHPELSGTPYAVLLGRLGAEDAERRGLLDDPAFQPGVRSSIDTACQWVAETSHALCGAFGDYWAAHGLELGDTGYSARESLALFGYPISDEFVDPETGLTTQYFERAVFEWHPDNSAQYQVLQRRLGAELLVARGWRVE